ncbi:MAG TPA: glycosyl hydrolase family 8 [Polyangiaceae bacterium]
MIASLRYSGFAWVALALLTMVGCERRHIGSNARSTPSQPGLKPASAALRADEANPPNRGAYLTGKYRNLFSEMGLASSEIDAKVDRAYAQLFHGNPNHETVMFPAASNERGPTAYIMDIGNGDIRSEGMSYGMMLAVEYNRKDDFDALWNWANAHMYHADERHPAFGYFSWQMRPDGSAIDEMPAADGEEYFATALLFASNRWGHGDGIFNYGAQARQLLDRMKNRRPITGIVNGKRDATAVALFNADHKMVRFTPDTGNFEKNGDHTDPSYHLPAFYELWALFGPEADRIFWSEAARASRDFFAKAAHPITALTPDYANFDGTPKAASWDAGTASFRYDAFRSAMNWAVDAVWWNKDAREVERSNRVLAFFDSKGAHYPNNYTLDGKPTTSNESLGLIAANAVVAMAATDPRAFRFVKDLYSQSIPTGKWRYYDGMLYTMALLHLSGRFRIYAPPLTEATSPKAQ